MPITVANHSHRAILSGINKRNKIKKLFWKLLVGIQSTSDRWMLWCCFLLESNCFGELKEFLWESRCCHSWIESRNLLHVLILAYSVSFLLFRVLCFCLSFLPLKSYLLFLLVKRNHEELIFELCFVALIHLEIILLFLNLPSYSLILFLHLAKPLVFSRLQLLPYHLITYFHSLKQAYVATL